MKRLSLFLLACAVASQAQSILITNPASGGTVSGYTYQFQVSVSSAPSVARVCYTVDAYPAYNPGIDAPTTLGCSISAGYSYPYNSFWNLNGSHQLVATAYNSLGNVVATSAAVPFTIANNWPVVYTPNMTVATGTPLTSNWAGSVNVTPTISGSGSADSKTFNFWVDGIAQGTSSAITATNYTFAINTVQFSNGNHNVCVTSTDATGGTTYADGTYVGAATEWCQSIDFQNGTSASKAINNAHDIYLAPGNNFSLTTTILNTDGSTSAASNPVFTSSNPAIATVNQSSGVITAVASGNAQVTAMAPTISGTDLTTVGPVNQGLVASVSHPFTSSQTGQLINITGGSNAIPGVYTITNVSGVVATLNTQAFSASSSNAVFSTGPTRVSWVLVWPTNTMACFGGNGAIYASYAASLNAANPCIVMHEMFGSIALLNADQPYNPGALTDFNSNFAKWWTFETGAIPSAISGMESPTGMAAWQTSQNAFAASTESIVSGYPNVKLYLTGDNFTRSSTSLWGSTNGPAGQWSTPAFEIAMQSWTGQSNVLGIAMQDEVNSSWSGAPLQGPLQFQNGSNNAQTWLQSIAAAGGTCTANVSGLLYNLNGASAFIIRNSATTGMNSALGSLYTATRAGNNFTFPCSGVPNGTYNASNDPGLTIEPYVAQWFASNTSYIPYTAFSSLRSQFVAAAPTFGMAWPNAGLTNCASVADWGGNGMQSIGSVTQVGDYSDMYPANGTTTYLVSRLSANTIINTQFNLGWTLRTMYGCYNPSLPFSALTSGTVMGAGNDGYGIGQGPQVGVTMTSGNLITFSAPHGIVNPIAGMTRLYITGATNSGSPQDSSNNNFFIQDCPTATTCHVTLAATDFSGSASGGQVNMQDGTTFALSGISASGTIPCGNTLLPSPYISGGICGNFFTLATASTTPQQKRGQTFNVTGQTGSSAFTSNTLLLLSENVNIATAHQYYFFRQVPSLSATGGTATIIHDDNYVKGRNASVDLNDMNPGWAFAEDVECIILRCSGVRIYKASPYASGYSDQSGFTSDSYTTQLSVFADTGVGSGGQLFMNQHFENDDTVPVFHAHNFAALIWNRLAKYLLQPAGNSPDYGSLIDCGAKSGNYGKALVCLNASDGPETETFALTPYWQSGQQILRYVVNDHSIAMSVIAAGTASDTLVLNPLDAVFYVFPITFAAEIEQPAIAVRLADVPNATTIVVRYAYDRYDLDAPTSNVFNCGTGACTPAWDRNIGTIYYRLIYLGSGLQVLATSDVLTL